MFNLYSFDDILYFIKQFKKYNLRLNRLILPREVTLREIEEITKKLEEYNEKEWINYKIEVFG